MRDDYATCEHPFLDFAAAKVPDLIGRDFATTEVDTKYVGDSTCLPLSGGTLRRPATVIDLASRRLAGWAIADRVRADLVIDALHVAERTPPKSSMSSYAHFNNPMLHRPVELTQYRSRAWDTEREAHLDLFRRPHRHNTVRRHFRLGHRTPTPHPHHRDVIHAHGAPGRRPAEGVASEIGA